ncbi:MAG TPA: hypothetical protein DIW24_04455 [Bacteroidetes bacterium]|nr:hypothetical protein [Bacteroidota bacterium]HRR07207.1 hypothetical protein [Rhodothermales bacterium]
MKTLSSFKIFSISATEQKEHKGGLSFALLNPIPSDANPRQQVRLQALSDRYYQLIGIAAGLWTGDPLNPPPPRFERIMGRIGVVSDRYNTLLARI